jgi:hypothetical protein
MTMVADDNNTQDWAADFNGEGQKRAVRDSGDSGVVMMAAAAEHGSGGQQWRQWAMTVMVNNDSGGQQRQQMTTACKIKRWTTRENEEGGRQTTTALGQPGRERETKIKKSSLQKKTFFSDMVCPVGVFAPAKNKFLSF